MEVFEEFRLILYINLVLAICVVGGTGLFFFLWLRVPVAMRFLRVPAKIQVPWAALTLFLGIAGLMSLVFTYDMLVDGFFASWLTGLGKMFLMRTLNLACILSAVLSNVSWVVFEASQLYITAERVKIMNKELEKITISGEINVDYLSE